VFFYGSANAAQVNLAWDGSSGAAGYNIYYGTEATNTYSTIKDVGNVTTCSLSLEDRKTYYIAATAYDSAGKESNLSNEVIYPPPICTSTLSPTSASVAASGPSGGSVSVMTQSDCSWSVSSTGANWITITSGANGGMGNGTVEYNVAANTGGERTASLTIAGKTFTISQSAQNGSYTITASAGIGGSISPSGSVSVSSGGSQTFTFTPNSGFRVSNVTVDDTSVGAVNSYTFNNVTAAGHTIAASFAVIPPTSYSSIWPSPVSPQTVNPWPSPVELGVKFRSDIAGYIHGIRFHKARTNTGTHVGHLWTSNGTRLATATFTNETASGWQQVNFSTPVAISANTIYVASYHTTKGNYSYDMNYFANKGADNAPLHALRNGVLGANGVYTYGPAGSFPTYTWNSTNYWVDVVFTAN
jgi:hypothetical protein